MVAIYQQGLQDYIRSCKDRWTFWAVTLKPQAHQCEPLYLTKPLWSASPSLLGNDEWLHVCEPWKSNWIDCPDSYLLLMRLLYKLNRRQANQYWLICFSANLILHQGKGNLQQLKSKGEDLCWHLSLPLPVTPCGSLEKFSFAASLLVCVHVLVLNFLGEFHGPLR